MKKEQIRTILEILKEHGGTHESYYMLKEEMDTASKCNGLYYSSASKLVMYKDSYRAYGHLHVDITDINKAVDEIYEILSKDMLSEFHQAMKNLGWEHGYEVLKYFDRAGGKKDYKKLKKEIDKLIKERQ